MPSEPLFAFAAALKLKLRTRERYICPIWQASTALGLEYDLTMSPDRRRGTVPQIAYEFLPCDNCEVNVNAAFDLLFELIMSNPSTLPSPTDDGENSQPGRGTGV